MTSSRSLCACYCVNWPGTQGSVQITKALPLNNQISNRCHGHKIGVKESISSGLKKKKENNKKTPSAPFEYYCTIYRIPTPFKPHTHKNVQVFHRVSASAATMDLAHQSSRSLLFLHTTK